MTMKRDTQRFRYMKFKDGVCPYCGSGNIYGEPNDASYWCYECDAINKFTNRKVKEWNLEYKRVGAP